MHKFDGSGADGATPWFVDQKREHSPRDCSFINCTAPFTYTGERADFGYANSPLANCKGTVNGSNWVLIGYCANPRLDIDNVKDVGVPENTNIDTPTDGDTFRSAVHYYGQDGLASQARVSVHPIINIYCGGTLKATYGQAPNRLTDDFNAGSAANDGYPRGMFWRVADVTATGTDAAGNTTCTVAPLHPPGTTDGYWVNTDKNNTDFSY